MKGKIFFGFKDPDFLNEQVIAQRRIHSNPLAGFPVFQNYKIVVLFRLLPFLHFLSQYLMQLQL